MRLYLAVAVLLLAFVAYTEAQETHEVTMEERFTQFGQHMSEFKDTVAEKVKTALADFHNNENVKKAKNWIQEQLDKLSSK